jgi:GNAT superfamily N-acetyltransferase
MKIEYITWEQIHFIWTNKLWPERKSKIEPATSMIYLGGHDMRNKKFHPIFVSIKSDDNEIMGVNSIVECYDGSVRSRGLWVNESCRGQGLASALLKCSIECAKKISNTYIWTVPRKSAMPAYESAGFKQTSDWFDEGMEYGPNCYAKLIL